MPHKKTRGGALTPTQKAENKLLSRRRVRVEHVNSSIKRLRILKESIRLVSFSLRDLVISISCALHNFRLSFSPWLPLS